MKYLDKFGLFPSLLLLLLLFPITRQSQTMSLGLSLRQGDKSPSTMVQNSLCTGSLLLNHSRSHELGSKCAREQKNEHRRACGSSVEQANE